MSENPKVTVLMPVYNGEKYIRPAIESILRQTYKDFEFLIINDGSTDESVNIIKSYHDDRIRVVNNKINLKLIQTLNNGIKLSRGKFIARMDCDDISMPVRLEKQVHFMENNPEVGVLGTGIIVIDEKGRHLKKYRYPSRNSHIRWSLCFYSPIVHPTVMIRRHLLLDCCGYNKKMLHAEDYDLWCRLCHRTKLSNLEEYLLYLRKHERNITKDYFWIHLRNVVRINKRFVNELTGLDVEEKTIESIKTKNFRKYDGQIRAFQYVMKLFDHFIHNEKLQKIDKKLIRSDAALRIMMVGALRFYDLRSLNFLVHSVKLDHFVYIKLMRKTLAKTIYCSA